MSQPPLRQPSGPLRSAVNAIECANLTQLFSVLRAALAEAISRTGGHSLAEEFEARLEGYAREHAWTALTGLPDLKALARVVPEVDARMLLTVYLDYSACAQQMAGKILGEHLLRTTLQEARMHLPPGLAELNARSPMIPLTGAMRRGP
jgi:hypothetical protein